MIAMKVWIIDAYDFSLENLLMSSAYSSRPLLLVNLKALADNYNLLSKMAAPARIGAAVKADAYGLGIERVSKALYGAGCRVFFVAHAGEGKILRSAIGKNASIYVLSGPTPLDQDLFFGQKLKPVINTLPQARDWAKAVSGVKQAPYAAIHCDTGMNRLGLCENDIEILAGDKALITALNIDLVMSHLACADEPENPMNKTQLANFKRMAAQLPMVNMSLANTGGIYLGRDYHFKLVRPGIGLYGGMFSQRDDNLRLSPVAELHAPVLQIRTIKKGETLGYNQTFTATKDMKIATVSAGYADGLPTRLSGTNNKIKAYAKLKGGMVPVVGRISMDYTILDISNAKGFIEIGQKAVFLGEQLEAQSQAAGLLSYELLTGLGQRCRRVYV